MEMTRYTDEELAEVVKMNLASSNTEWSSKVAEQRTTAFEYFYGDRPAVVQKNTSDHVSRDVFDAVSSIGEKMLRVFTSGRKVVRFTPLSEDDVKFAAARTKYVDAVVMRKNDGYLLLQTAIQDALLQKVCCFKRHWKRENVKVPQSFKESEDVVTAAMSQGLDVTEIEDVTEEVIPVPTMQGPIPVPVRMVTGTAMQDQDRSRIVVEAVPPEDIFIDGAAPTVQAARFIAARWRKTRAELIAEGFPADIVNDLSPAESITVDGTDTARRSVDMTIRNDVSVEERALLTGYEAYLWLDAETPKSEDAGAATLWQVICCADKVLHKEPVAEMPFRFWSPIHIAHKPIGMSIADVTVDLQKTNSNIVRGILDNVYRVNTGLRIANLSILRNARDLIDNPIGGVIDSPDPTAVSVIPQPGISSATGLLLELMSSEKEARTGDTRLAKGMENQNVITHQNSEGMIDMLIGASNERVLGLARAFAETCWKPLMLDIYRLGYENDYAVGIEIDGKYTEFSPRQAPYSESCDVSVALTPEEGVKHAQRLMSIHAVMSKDPALSPLYGAKEKYAVWSQVFDLLGEPNWLCDPTSKEGAARMQQAAQQQQQMAQVAMQKEMAPMAKAQADAAAKRDDLQLKALAKADEQALKEAQFSWQKLVDAAEVDLERRQDRPVALGKEKNRAG